jgi:hypothetical protein
VRRYNVNNTSEYTTTNSKYQHSRAVVVSRDALDRTEQNQLCDSFSDGVPRTTLAYPTTITDPDSKTSTAKYNFDFGAMTYKQAPLPNVTTNTPGPEQTFSFDDKGRLERITNLVNNAYTRYVYGRISSALIPMSRLRKV